MPSDVMTVDHPRWNEFCVRLEGPEGCNFVEEKPGDPKSITWKCSSKPDFELATPILKSMGMDVEKSIAYFREHGGYCDCEILFNVERSAQRERKLMRRRKKHVVRPAKKGHVRYVRVRPKKRLVRKTS